MRHEIPDYTGGFVCLWRRLIKISVTQIVSGLDWIFLLYNWAQARYLLYTLKWQCFVTVVNSGLADLLLLEARYGSLLNYI